MSGGSDLARRMAREIFTYGNSGHAFFVAGLIEHCPTLRAVIEAGGYCQMKHRPTWSDEEVAELRTRFYEGETDAQMADALDRTPYAVKTKRLEHGMKRDEAWRETVRQYKQHQQEG